MVDPRQPYPPYHRAPVPVVAPKAKLPTALIAALVIGGVGMLGLGGLVVVGTVWYLSAQRPATIVEAEGTADGGPTTTAEASRESEPGQPTSVGDGTKEPGAPGAAASGEQERHDAPGAAGTEPSESVARRSAGNAGSPGKTLPSGGNWRCTASASVRVCGFAGACNYQMVFGNGFGKDRFLASQQAKNACQASARAKGAAAVCAVQCSVR